MREETKREKEKNETTEPQNNEFKRFTETPCFKVIMKAQKRRTLVKILLHCYYVAIGSTYKTQTTILCINVSSKPKLLNTEKDLPIFNV